MKFELGELTITAEVRIDLTSLQGAQRSELAIRDPSSNSPALRLVSTSHDQPEHLFHRHSLER